MAQSDRNFNLAASASEAMHLEARNALSSQGRVHLPDFISDATARALVASFERVDWTLVLTGGGQSREIAVERLYQMDRQAKASLLSAAYAQARAGFQCLYEAYRFGGLYEEGLLPAGALADFFAGMNSDDGIAALRQLTGDDRIVYVDATATRFGPGQFLTTHSDEVKGDERLYAYVLNLTPTWLTHWGGLLLFHREDGHVSEAYCPRWRALNVFSVPQPHSVSVVAPYAGATRYAISGWMRGAAPRGSRFERRSPSPTC